MKKILITGADSFIGENFAKFVKEFHSDELITETIDMRDETWKNKDFSGYDALFHVAGIAHVSYPRKSEKIRKQYICVNTDLAVQVCLKAKKEGIKQFVFMSSSCVYGECSSVKNIKIISSKTVPSPTDYYGESKLLAESKINALADESFLVSILRVPMVYGKGAKGNYHILSELAKKTPVFPKFHNVHSIIYVENLCEFVSQIITRQMNGIFWPQNKENTGTLELVKAISEIHRHKIVFARLLNIGIYAASCFHGKIGRLIKKAFGCFSYDQNLSSYDFEYCITGFEESVRKTEA